MYAFMRTAGAGAHLQAEALARGGQSAVLEGDG
jgi:hypothetical protein